MSLMVEVRARSAPALSLRGSGGERAREGDPTARASVGGASSGPPPPSFSPPRRQVLKHEEIPPDVIEACRVLVRALKSVKPLELRAPKVRR